MVTIFTDNHHLIMYYAKNNFNESSKVGYFIPTIAFSSFLMVLAVSPLHVDAFARK